MAIPEEQLKTWSAQGAVPGSRDTYATVKSALEATDAPYAGKKYKVFLQGSYGNDTNIYAESDVDIVIRLDSTFHRDLDQLSDVEKAAYAASYPDATYRYEQFQADVIAVLRKRFGNAVDLGSKAVRIKPEGNRRSADVIIATQYRRYRRFRSLVDEDYEPGIRFVTSGGQAVVNYPEQHSANCTTKHQSASSRFKPMVRIFKNLRGRLVTNGKIKSGVAPSYFIEGLLYNVPPELFSSQHGDTFVAAVNWMIKSDPAKFVTANEQYYLLGDSSVQWPRGNYDSFRNEAAALWNNWSGS
jgi:hypothetical protein